MLRNARKPFDEIHQTGMLVALAFGPQGIKGKARAACVSNAQSFINRLRTVRVEPGFLT